MGSASPRCQSYTKLLLLVMGNSESKGGIPRQIENCLHLVLDVSFGEDRSRIRSSYAPENMAVIRRMANDLLRTDTTPKRTMKAKMRSANRLPEYIQQIITAPLVGTVLAVWCGTRYGYDQISKTGKLFKYHYLACPIF
jgi:hypothetical protein